MNNTAPFRPNHFPSNAEDPSKIFLTRGEQEVRSRTIVPKQTFFARLLSDWQAPRGRRLRRELAMMWMGVAVIAALLFTSLSSLRGLSAEISRVASSASTKSELHDKVSKSDLDNFQTRIVAMIQRYQQQTTAQLRQATDAMGDAIAERKRTEEQLLSQVEQLRRKQNEQSLRQRHAISQAAVSSRTIASPSQVQSRPAPPAESIPLHSQPSLSHPAYDGSIPLPPGAILNVGSDGVQDWKVSRSDDGITKVIEVWPLEQTAVGVLVYVPSENQNWFITPEGGWMGGAGMNGVSP